MRCTIAGIMIRIALLNLLLPVLCAGQDQAAFPRRAAETDEITTISRSAKEISALEARDLEFLNATDFGVRCDSSHDDTAAATAALNAAWSTGKVLRFPAGICILGNIVLPAPTSTLNQTLSFRGAGTGNWFGDTNPIRGGTFFRFTRADGSDFMIANSTAFATPTYQIADISIIGPDGWHGEGKGVVGSSAKSGSGLKFIGKAAPRLLINNVSIQGFYGPGTAGLWVSNAEDSSLYDVSISSVDRCAQFSEAFNASTVVNFQCSAAMHDGVFITDSESVAWLGGLFQSNRTTGLHIKGMISSSFTSVHFENNNWSEAEGEAAVKIEAIYTQGCARFGSCLSNQNLVLTGNVFNAPTDRVIALGGGPGGWNNSNITFLHGYMNGVRAPAFTLNEYSLNWRIVGIIGIAEDASAIADSGTGNVMLVGNQMIGLHDGTAVSAIGNADVSRNLRVLGDEVFPALKSKTGTRFVCIDQTGKLLSQVTPCSGT